MRDQEFGRQLERQLVLGASLNGVLLLEELTSESAILEHSLWKSCGCCILQRQVPSDSTINETIVRNLRSLASRFDEANLPRHSHKSYLGQVLTADPAITGEDRRYEIFTHGSWLKSINRPPLTIMNSSSNESRTQDNSSSFKFCFLSNKPIRPSQSRLASKFTGQLEQLMLPFRHDSKPCVRDSKIFTYGFQIVLDFHRLDSCWFAFLVSSSLEYEIARNFPFLVVADSVVYTEQLESGKFQKKVASQEQLLSAGFGRGY